MITYYPSYILGSRLDCIYDSRQVNFHYLPLWEYFARRALAWNRNALECINDTSGRGCYTPQGFGTDEAVHKALARIFACAGAANTTGLFLCHCGIKRWSDLAKPIRVVGWDRRVPFEHDVRERKIRLPGPNRCHPDAIYGQCCTITFDTDLRWHFRVYYGYSRDDSPWSVEIRQNAGESLFRFGRRIPAYLDTLFEPDDPRGAHFRTGANRDYARLSQAVSETFWDRYVGTSKKLIDILMNGSNEGCGAHKVVLTTKRLAVLRRWIAADRKAKP